MPHSLHSLTRSRRSQRPPPSPFASRLAASEGAARGAGQSFPSSSCTVPGRGEDAPFIAGETLPFTSRLAMGPELLTQRHRPLCASAQVEGLHRWGQDPGSSPARTVSSWPSACDCGGTLFKDNSYTTRWGAGHPGRSPFRRPWVTQIADPSSDPLLSAAPQFLPLCFQFANNWNNLQNTEHPTQDSNKGRAPGPHSFPPSTLTTVCGQGVLHVRQDCWVINLLFSKLSWCLLLRCILQS